MVSSVYWEWSLLMYAIKLGIKMAFVYDGIRIFRLLISHQNFWISIEDLFYWIYVTVIMFRTQLEYSDGVLRGFAILGMAIGMITYNRLLGERLIALAKKWIGFIKRLLTARMKMLKIKLCKHERVSVISRRGHGKKKISGKEKKTKPFRNDIGIHGGSDIDVSSGGE